MALSYTIDPSRRRIILRAWGVLRETDIVGARTRLHADPSFDSAYDELFDASDVDDFALSKETMSRLVDSTILVPSNRRAFVAKTTLQFGMTQMFVSVSESRNHSVQVFRERAEAEAWLDSPKTI